MVTVWRTGRFYLEKTWHGLTYTCSFSDNSGWLTVACPYFEVPMLGLSLDEDNSPSECTDAGIYGNHRSHFPNFDSQPIEAPTNVARSCSWGMSKIHRESPGQLEGSLWQNLTDSSLVMGSLAQWRSPSGRRVKSCKMALFNVGGILRIDD